MFIHFIMMMILAVVGLRGSEQVLSSCSAQALRLPRGMWSLSSPIKD